MNDLNELKDLIDWWAYNRYPDRPNEVWNFTDIIDRYPNTLQGMKENKEWEDEFK